MHEYTPFYQLLSCACCLQAQTLEYYRYAPMTERTCAVVEAVVFDMDGTLVDSESVSVASWRATAAELGFPWPDSVGRTLIGRNVTSCMKLLTDHLQGDSELAERAMQLHIDLFNIMAENDLQLMAGAREALQALKGAGMARGAGNVHASRARGAAPGALRFARSLRCDGVRR